MLGNITFILTIFGYQSCEVVACIFHNFCVDAINPSRTLKCFPNNEPWIPTDLKNLFNKMKRDFRNGDREEQRRMQKELKVKLKESREVYVKKLESKLQQNNVKDVWSGMKTITRFMAKRIQAGEGQ